ncbi:MAG: FeoB-associated Cys-rich membrane protein [Lachnospiraceae bacterium]|nr:FeoB-associated Cys-rich membrane protein [Lachnospiraceae bacterium]
MVILIIAGIVFVALFYLYRAKKRGEKCIGCPYAKQCADKKCS